MIRNVFASFLDYKEHVSEKDIRDHVVRAAVKGYDCAYIGNNPRSMYYIFVSFPSSAKSWFSSAHRHLLLESTDSDCNLHWDEKAKKMYLKMNCKDWIHLTKKNVEDYFKTH